MTYKTGSITSNTPGRALFDLLDPDIVGVGFVRVETGHTAGGVTWNVYRSPAASNFFGSDWYFALGYDTTGQTTLYSCVMEDWNETSKLASRFAPSTAALVPGIGYINPQSPAALPAGFTLSHALPATVFTYAYSTLIDRVAIAAWTSTTVGRFSWYIGLYDSFYSTVDDPFPLCICVLGKAYAQTTNVRTDGASTREPMTTTSNTDNFAVIQGGRGNISNVVYPYIWNTPVINLYQGSRNWISRVVVGGRGGQNTSIGGQGVLSYPRGMFRDIYATAWTNPLNGDRYTWTSNGQSYAGVMYRETSALGPILIAEY